MPVRAYLFDAQGNDHEIQLKEDLAEDIGDKQILWVNVTDATQDDLNLISGCLKIKQEVLKSALQPATHTTIHTVDNYVHLTVIEALKKGAHIKPLPLELIAGPNYVVALHSGTIGFLESFDEQTRGETQLGELDSGTFLVALLNRFINSYFDILDELGVEVDRLDERALNNKGGQKLLDNIVRLRHQVSELRQLLTPHRIIFTTLASPDFGKVAFLDSEPDFSGLLTRLEKAMDGVENTREMVIGSFEVFTTVTAQSTNDTVRLLTVITVVIGLSGVIAGIMGMNFADWDFFHTGAFGFASVVVGMVILVVVTLAVAKWRRLY